MPKDKAEISDDVTEHLVLDPERDEILGSISWDALFSSTSVGEILDKIWTNIELTPDEKIYVTYKLGYFFGHKRYVREVKE